MADELVAYLAGHEMQETALKLRKLLTPPPTMEEILRQVPGDTIVAKAKQIGMSRQGYYALLQGTAKRSEPVARRLSQLTGVDLETIKSVW